VAKANHIRDGSSSARDSLKHALTNLALLLIDQGITAAEMHALNADAFVSAAMQRSRLKNGRVNQSRVAIMTGLTRTEIRRKIEAQSLEAPRIYGVQRVMDGWRRDPEFCDSSGASLDLKPSGDYGSFESLARKYSGDIPPRATLEEMRRLKVVDTRRGLIHLRPESESANRRRQRALTEIATQLSEALGTLGYPEIRAPEVLLTDSTTVEVFDHSLLQVLKKRAEQSARVMLSGIDTSMRSVARRGAKTHAKSKGSIRVSVSVIQYNDGDAK
jgi:hypothetical protein